MPRLCPLQRCVLPQGQRFLCDFVAWLERDGIRTAVCAAAAARTAHATAAATAAAAAAAATPSPAATSHPVLTATTRDRLQRLHHPDEPRGLRHPARRESCHTPCGCGGGEPQREPVLRSLLRPIRLPWLCFVLWHVLPQRRQRVHRLCARTRGIPPARCHRPVCTASTLYAMQHVQRANESRGLRHPARRESCHPRARGGRRGEPQRGRVLHSLLRPLRLPRLCFV